MSLSLSPGAAFAALRLALQSLSLTLSPAVSLSVDNALVEKLLSAYLSAHTLKTASDVRALTAAALLWLVQQAVLLCALGEEFDATDKELLALWTRFNALDDTLSGVIDTQNLEELLQTLGGTYSAQELDAVRRTLDFDDSELCAFSDFVRWWCEG